MTMSMRSALVAATASFVAVPALAASVAQSTGTVRLLFPDVPPGVFVFRSEGNSDVQTYVPSFSTTIDLASGVEAEEAAPDDLAEFNSFCTPSSCSGLAPGDTESVFVQNYDGPNPASVATGPITISGMLEYDLSAFASVDDPDVDLAFATVDLAFFADASSQFDAPLFEASARAESPMGGPATDATAGSFAFELTLDPDGRGIFDTIELGVVLEAVSFADDASPAGPAPIPLPAAMPLFLAGLGGLALLRRRR